MSNYKVGDFHWVKYGGDWTIAMFCSNEDDGTLNDWLLFGKSYRNREYELEEIDETPIKRK